MRLCLTSSVTIGCGPECLVDPDCQYGYVCSQQRCVERPDPCDPSPCGPGAEASVRGDQCQCSCPQGTVGDPYTSCHRGECTQVSRVTCDHDDNDDDGDDDDDARCRLLQTPGDNYVTPPP